MKNAPAGSRLPVEMMTVTIDKLIPYANNARTHSEEQIRKLRSSIREFGFNDPVVIDEGYTILSGHGRFAAAKEEGFTEIPCAMVKGLTEGQKKAYILAANRLALDAGWDEELLAAEFESLKEFDFDLDLTGFDAAEFEMFLDEENEEGTGEDLPEDDNYDLTAALEEASFVEAGDLWYVGDHRLLCGDSTNAEDVARLMDGAKADLVLTDPPYNVAIESEHGLKIKNDKMSSDQFYEFLVKGFQNMADNAKDAAVIYVFYADMERVNFQLSLLATGWYLSETLIWNKNNLTLGRCDYHWKHEPILYGWKKGGVHHWYGDRKQTTVWNFAKPLRADTHPTSKPTDMLCYAISNSSQKGDIVLDLFGGSGSTLIAAQQMGRRCYMSEYDPTYASVILRRYAAETGDTDNIYVIRNGEKLMYSELVKELTKDGEHAKRSNKAERIKAHRNSKRCRTLKGDKK